MRALNERGRIILAVLLLGGSVLIYLTSCAPIPRTLPPALSSWAAHKAAKLAECYEAGHRRQALLECLGDYAADRGTYACERTRAALENQ